VHALEVAGLFEIGSLDFAQTERKQLVAQLEQRIPRGYIVREFCERRE